MPTRRGYVTATGSGQMTVQPQGLDGEDAGFALSSTSGATSPGRQGRKG